jgi:hypothetical protein
LSRGKNEGTNEKENRTSIFVRKNKQIFLSVGLGDTLKLILLFNGVAVGATFGGVDQLVGQTLGNGLDIPEGGFASSGAQQPDRLDKHYTTLQKMQFYFIKIIKTLCFQYFGQFIFTLIQRSWWYCRESSIKLR